MSCPIQYNSKMEARSALEIEEVCLRMSTVSTHLDIRSRHRVARRSRTYTDTTAYTYIAGRSRRLKQIDTCRST
jgi:hypothetical protein